jgi:hypothetical protein
VKDREPEPDTELFVTKVKLASNPQVEMRENEFKFSLLNQRIENGITKANMDLTD